MKVYLMTDMEGVSGVINAIDWVYRDSLYYEIGKELLTKEVNAAVDGFFAAGADEVIVHDGHGKGGINIRMLDPRAKMQRGWVGPYPCGLNETYDVIAWVGQHPKSQTEYGHICHTGDFDVLRDEVNGIAVGEFGHMVFLSQLYNVVPIFASGCVAFTKEAQEMVKGIETVAVKEGLMPGSGDECTTEQYRDRNFAAIHVQPETARKMIRDGAERALRRYWSNPESFCRLQTVSPPYSRRVMYRDGRVEDYVGDDLVAVMNEKENK